MTTYTIEQDVPLASRYNGRPPSQERKAMESLQVGQSFLISEADRVHLARCIASRMGERKFTVRKQREGWRVWRLE